MGASDRTPGLLTPAEVKAVEDFLPDQRQDSSALAPGAKYTPGQLLDNMCNRILNFALDHGLTASELEAIFNGGMAALRRSLAGALRA